MRRDYELRIILHKIIDERQQREQPCRRECCLGLVEYVEPVATEAVLDDREKALAVGLVVQRLAAVAVDY